MEGSRTSTVRGACSLPTPPGPTTPHHHPAAQACRPPLAPGEEPVLLSGPEEVEHLYQLYTTTAAERRLFPKDRTVPPTDLPTLRSAIRRQIRRFPAGAGTAGAFFGF